MSSGPKPVTGSEKRNDAANGPVAGPAPAPAISSPGAVRSAVRVNRAEAGLELPAASRIQASGASTLTTPSARGTITAV